MPPLKIKLGGILFELSFPLVAVMTAVILYDSSLSAAVCFVSVLLHEGGHLLALIRFGCKPRRIRLTLFDIAIEDRRGHLRDFRREMIVVLAGPAVNLAAGSAACLLHGMLHDPVTELLINSNFTLAVFNLLPVGTLDGGQAVLMLLCQRLETDKAIKAADILSAIIIVPLGILGFLVLLRSRYNFSLLLTAVYLMGVLLLKEPHRFRSKKQEKKQ